MNAVSWHAAIFAVIFALMVTGLVTLLFSRSSYTKIRAVPFALVYGVGAVVWLASLVYAQFVAGSLLSHRFSFSAAYALALGMLGVALTFPNSSLGRRTKGLLALDTTLGLSFAGLIFFTDTVLKASNFSGARTAPFSPLGKVYLVVIAAHLVLAIAVFVRRYLREIRNRLYFNYIVLAFILLALIGATTNLILPLLGIVSLAIVGPLASLLPFVAIVYALGITDINDVNYVVAQLVQVGVRLVALALLFVVGAVVGRLPGIGYYTTFWVIIMALLAGLGILGFYLFGNMFDRFIEDRIAYSRLSPDNARARLILGLSGAIELERNLTLVLKLIKQTIGVRAVGVVIRSKDGILKTAGELGLLADEAGVTLAATEVLERSANQKGLIASATLPEELGRMLEAHGIYGLKPFMRTESGIAGLYLLGEKFSQEVFTRQDATLMHALTEISDLSIERALFYNQIQAFNATLQQRVDDATKRLRAANTRLKTLDAMKDDFISMASHQLRSPATSLRDAIKLLEQSYVTPAERKKIVELADASSERLVNVITDMLSVARIQAGHFTVDKAELDMAELVDRTLAQAAALAQAKHVRLRFDRPQQPVMVRADRAKLIEILSNYLENAIRYSHEGTTVEVLLKPESKRVSFEVRDHGIGVPAANRKHLFTRFYRAANARREQPNGNGIGLFVVKTVARAHGGDAYYLPQSDGSTFGFWLKP